MGGFQYLNAGLALVLAFVGAKMLMADWYKLPTVASLSIVVVLLTSSIVASLIRPPKEALPQVYPPQGRPSATID
jgi:tellurite resistance protein TerC